MTLRGVDLGERDGRKGRRRWRSDTRRPSSDRIRDEPTIDHARQEIARTAKPPAGLLLSGLFLERDQDLVDELGHRERSRTDDAVLFGFRDELFAGQLFEFFTGHRVCLERVRRRRNHRRVRRVGVSFSLRAKLRRR